MQLCNNWKHGFDSLFLSAPAAAVQAIQDVMPLGTCSKASVDTLRVEHYITCAWYHDNTSHKSLQNTMLFFCTPQ